MALAFFIANGIFPATPGDRGHGLGQGSPWPVLKWHGDYILILPKMPKPDHVFSDPFQLSDTPYGNLTVNCYLESNLPVAETFPRGRADLKLSIS